MPDNQNYSSTNALVSDCHSYAVRRDGACKWCGQQNGTHSRYSDALLKEIEAAIVDWNRPSQLQDHDVEANVSKIAVLICKERERFIEPLAECIATAAELRRHINPDKGCGYATYRRVWDASRDAEVAAIKLLPQKSSEGEL